MTLSIHMFTLAVQPGVAGLASTALIVIGTHADLGVSFEINCDH